MRQRTLHLKIAQDQVDDLERLQARLGIERVDDLLNHAVALLKWVVREKERGCTVLSIDDKAKLHRELAMPVLDRVTEDAGAVSSSHLPTLVADQVRNLLEEQRVEEAMDAAQVGEIFRRGTAEQPPEAASSPQRVERAMKLEAAKIFAEEGDPTAAVRLVEEVGKDSKTSAKKRAKRPKRPKPPQSR